MRSFLRWLLFAVPALWLIAGAQIGARAESIWGRESDGTMVHRPSGIRVSEQTGSFHRKNEHLGEWQDYRVFYARNAEQGTVLVSFSGIHTPTTDGASCGTMIDRSAGYADRKVWHKERLEPWRDLAPLFAGMEMGRAAVYNTVLDLDDVDLPMRAEVYILCGTGGSWIVEYESRYPRGVDGSGWIEELIAETAPR
jgi:hypothetical protein